MEFTHMVALGSSFAAGPGIEPVVDRDAQRSARNYPHLVADRLGALLVDATVSGATTSTILDDVQRVRRRSFQPQIEELSEEVDLVTVTAGGNDLGYLTAVGGTAMLQQFWRRRLTRPVARLVRARRPLRSVTAQQRYAASTGLARIVEVVRERAPRARVVLVDYLPIMTAQTVTGPGVPFRPHEIDHFRGVALALSEALRTAARRSGADLVAAADLSQDHGIGSSEPWVVGLQPLPRIGASFHPNAAGMEAVAAAILNRLERAPGA